VSEARDRDSRLIATAILETEKRLQPEVKRLRAAIEKIKHKSQRHRFTRDMSHRCVYREGLEAVHQSATVALTPEAERNPHPVTLEDAEAEYHAEGEPVISEAFRRRLDGDPYHFVKGEEK
jgi:hypothetical protein